ncbi:hypothetical protein KHP62_13560 [Rhodobacteraceae bacterium NNCM2]|nr:hypothetical protein [Coraliihabitans acroporae]
MSSKLLAVLSSFALAMMAGSAAATTLTLDFGNLSSSGFNNSAGNTIEYGVVANDGTSDI